MADQNDDIPDPALGGRTPKQWRAKYGAITNKEKGETVQMMLDQAKALRGGSAATPAAGFGSPLAALGDIAQAVAARHVQDRALREKGVLMGSTANALENEEQFRQHELGQALHPEMPSAPDVSAPVMIDPGAQANDQAAALRGDAVTPGWGMDLTGAEPQALSPKQQILQAIAQLQSQPPPGGG